MKCKQLGLKATQIPKKTAYLGGIQELIDMPSKGQKVTRDMIKSQILSLFKEFLLSTEMDIIRKEENYWYALIVAKPDRCNETVISSY